MTAEDAALADRLWGLAEPTPVAWGSGPWSLELRGDELADLRYEGVLVLRAVRAVARDRDWATVPVEITDLRLDPASLALGLRMHGLGADLEGSLRATVADGALTVTFDAVSHSDFLRNRAGLVVLHPPTVAGAPLAVLHPDGSRDDAFFPREISPHQPAFDIAGLDWPEQGVDVSLRFTGEVFEMEDQRNWTDASFKTYSTPLALPFPVLLPAGGTISQSLTLRAVGTGGASTDGGEATIELVDTGTAVPAIALGASTAPDPAPADLPPVGSALLVELDLRTPSWRAALERALLDAAGLPLDVRIVAPADADLSEVVDAIRPLRVTRAAVYDAATHVSERGLVVRLRAALAETDFSVVGGARSHFTELNRNHDRLPEDLDAITFSVTPQMHATERSQLVESVAMQREVATNAIRIAGGRPVVVGPITLKARYNAVATSSGPEARPDLSAGYGAQLFDATDVRQESTALAAWTIASAAASSVPGVSSLIYFERWGPRGVVDATGRPYPVLTVLEELAALSGLPLLAAASPGRAQVWAIGARRGDAVDLLIANLGTASRSVRATAPGTVPQVVEVPPLGIARATLTATRA